MKAKKSWTDKLNSKIPHKLKRMPIDIAGMKKGELCLVPSVKMIDNFIHAIPEGVSIEVAEMRKTLAKRYEAEVTCPIYTGFHLRTVAEAACEAHANGAKLDEIAPVWRVLDESTPTTKKLSKKDAALILKQRKREGL